MWDIVRFVEGLTRKAGILGAWMVVPLVLAIVYEVVSRYAFHAPTVWAFEVGYMLTGTNLMLGIAYALQKRRHIRIDFLYATLSAKRQALIDVAGYLILVPFLGWLAWALWGYVVQAYVTHEGSALSAWNPQVWPFRVTFVVGFALLGLQAAVEMFRAVCILLGREVREPGP